MYITYSPVLRAFRLSAQKMTQTVRIIRFQRLIVSQRDKQTFLFFFNEFLWFILTDSRIVLLFILFFH